MVMEPCDPPSSLFAARSAITSNGRPGICTVPSHRPAAFSSAREMNADARSKINATRMRSPLHALCPRCEEVVNHWLQGYYAATASENNESTSRRRDTLIPFLGKIRSTEVQSDRSPFWRDAKSPSRTGVARETRALPGVRTSGKRTTTIRDRSRTLRASQLNRHPRSDAKLQKSSNLIPTLTPRRLPAVVVTKTSAALEKQISRKLGVPNR